MVNMGENVNFVKNLHERSTVKDSAEEEFKAAKTGPDQKAALHRVKSADKAIKRHLNPTSQGVKLTVD